MELAWVARKIGLGLRPEDDPNIPVDDWIEAQLTGSFPRLCIESVEVPNPAVVEWPVELTFDLKTRIERMMSRRRRAEQIDRSDLDPIEYEKQHRENRLAYDMRVEDEYRFANAAIYGADQIKQRLLHFWINHFTVGDQGSAPDLIGDYHDLVYEGLDWSFADLLYRATSHPAMLTYLDNVQNIGWNSRKARGCKASDCVVGINDNLARELMELHSVSPARGYTEDDIHEAAKVLAGWGQVFELEENGPPPDGDWSQPWFVNHAEPGPKKVLGLDIPDGRGGLRVLTDMLAADDFSRRFISRKLAIHFIGDSATEADIAPIEAAWAASGGHLPTVHRAVLRQALASQTKRFHWPLTWMFQVLRMSGADLLRGYADMRKTIMGVDRDCDHIMNELGNSFWSNRQPNGFSDRTADWISTEHFDRRFRIAGLAHQHGRPKLTAEQIVERHRFGEATIDLVAHGNGPGQKFILFACSPEMMEV